MTGDRWFPFALGGIVLLATVTGGLVGLAVAYLTRPRARRVPISWEGSD